MRLGTMLEEIRGKHRYATADDIRNVPSARKTVFRWGVPIALGVLIHNAPTTAGLSANAWHYFALFAAVIVALITEPLPGAAVGLIGVSLLDLAPYLFLGMNINFIPTPI